jgi:hypothetical protein
VGGIPRRGDRVHGGARLRRRQERRARPGDVAGAVRPRAAGDFRAPAGNQAAERVLRGQVQGLHGADPRHGVREPPRRAGQRRRQRPRVRRPPLAAGQPGVLVRHGPTTNSAMFYIDSNFLCREMSPVVR